MTKRLWAQSASPHTWNRLKPVFNQKAPKAFDLVVVNYWRFEGGKVLIQAFPLKNSSPSSRNDISLQS